MKQIGVLGMLLSLAVCQAARADISVSKVQKKEDTVKVTVKDEVLYLDITCPSGIGDVRLKLDGGQWPKKAIVRFFYGPDKPFTMLEGFHGWMEKEGVPKTGGQVNVDFKNLTPKGKPVEARIDITPQGAEVLSLHWIDAYRH